MSLALPLLAAFAVAPLLGGRWSRIVSVRIRVVWIFYLAIAIQVVAFPFKRLPWRTSDHIGMVLWIISFFLFLLAMAVNTRLPGVPFIALGLISNLTAVLANGGHMPALPSALRAAGMHFVTSNNSTAMTSPNLAWLVDRWAMPSWVPWGNVFSVGDVSIMAGGVLFVLLATGALRYPRISFRRRALRTANASQSLLK
jgi:Family of unknown function (DUF5317)